MYMARFFLFGWGGQGSHRTIRILMLPEKPYHKQARYGPGLLFSGLAPSRETP